MLPQMIDTIDPLAQRLHHVRGMRATAGAAAGEERRIKNLLGKRELLHLRYKHPLATAEEHECACSCGCCQAGSRRRWGPQAPLSAA